MPKDNTALEPSLRVAQSSRPGPAAAVKFFRIRDLERYQHYRDRNPPWVKLHGELLEDYEFQQLPDAARFHYFAMVYLASKSGNKIPNDPNWVARRIGAHERVDLELLFNERYLEPWRPRPQDSYEAGEQLELPEADATPAGSTDTGPSAAETGASNMLASRYQVASPETETETQKHTETDTAPASAGRVCGCCGVSVFSRFDFGDAFALSQSWKQRGKIVGGRPIENPGGLARKLHREGTADDEIAEMKFPRPREPKKKKCDPDCPLCFGTGKQQVIGKGVVGDCPNTPG